MIIATKFNGYANGRRRHFLDMGGDSTTVQAAPAPDTTALANASKESAEIMAKLGQDQLTESKRQYDTNIAVAKPVADAQLGLMRQTQAQGDEYFNYWKDKAQPVENALNADAMAAGTDARQQEAVDRAVADAQGGFTRSINQTLRQARRYGLNPALNAGTMAMQQGSATAAAATGARDKEKALGFAKKMDVAGLYRGMPGASQGAYSVANQSGNSAVGNTMAPGAQLQAGLASGAGTIGAGRQLYQSGLGGVLGAQTSYAGQINQMNLANAQMAQQGSAGIGQLLGTGLTAAATYFSSEELKEDKQPVDGELITKGLQRIPIEAWKYKEGVADEGEHIGPYAEDVNEEFGEAAAPGGKVLDAATMNGIALLVAKSNADRLDRIEKKLGLERRA